MADVKFTPGPWRISNCDVKPTTYNDGRRFLEVLAGDQIRSPHIRSLQGYIDCGGTSVCHIQHGPREANANLIAASPDLYDALDQVMTGGNHLASILVNRVGADFAERFPPEMEPEDALRTLCATDQYDVWCCWREIMLARPALAKARGES